MFYHIKNIDGNRRTACPDKGHAKRLSALKDPFHIGHNFKRPVIGIQQKFETVIPFLELNAKLFDITGCRFRLFNKKLFKMVQQRAHNFMFSGVKWIQDI
jgi:hypothetical protein